MEIAIALLASLTVVTPDYLNTSPTFLPTPDGAYIISHVRKANSSQLTNFVLSLAHPPAYAILTTIDTPLKIRIPTTITLAGSHHQQIVHIQLNPHNRSMLGRAYLGLFQNPHTQSMHPIVTIPTLHQTKRLTGRRSAKEYKEFARESAYEAEGKQPPLPTPMSAGTNTTKHNLLARGGPHNHTRAKPGPLHGPPAWTFTRTFRRRELPRARPSTTASRRPRPGATPQRTPPGEPILRTTSPPSTRSLKQWTTPTSHQPTVPGTDTHPPRGHPRRRTGGCCGIGNDKPTTLHT